MWILMYVSYLLMGMSFVLLGLTGLMGYFNFTVMNANHMQFALISSILYMFTETLIMFYFIITGKKIKEYIKENQCDLELYSGVIKMKMKLFPHVTINMVIVGAQFILGGAVHSGAIPGWAHGLMFDVALLHFLWVISIQHNCFKENTELVITLHDQVQLKQPS
jgi:hypothetical protein